MADSNVIHGEICAVCGGMVQRIVRQEKAICHGDNCALNNHYIQMEQFDMIQNAVKAWKANKPKDDKQGTLF
jgi:hypothetical protein